MLIVCECCLRKEAMARFKLGDRVEVSGEVARCYTCPIGVVTDIQRLPTCDEFTLRLANGHIASFVDFQLRKPPAMTAQLLFDSSQSAKSPGLRGGTNTERHLRFGALDRDIHLKISASDGNIRFLGEVTSPAYSDQCSLVTWRRANGIEETISTNTHGEFQFNNLTAGIVQLEVFEPSLRIVISFLA
jgi:hypothetical protein